MDLIQHLTQASGGTVVDEFDYELNDAGNITKITEVDDSYWTYAYDVRDRLTTASLKNSSGNVSADWSYTYDDADNMLTKVAPFMDDFNDGNTTGWTAAAGTWSASSYYLEDTGAGTSPILWKNDFTDDDHEARFRIRRTNSTAYPMFYVRYTNSSNWVRLEFSGTNSGLNEKVSGSASFLDTNTDGAMTEDTWYNLRVVADGDNVKVWIAEDGEMPALIYDETVDAVNESSSKVGFHNTTGSTVEYDDIWLIGASLDNTYTMTYNTANELTSMVQPNGAGTMSYSFDDWGRTTQKTDSTFTADLSWRYGGFLEEYDSDFPEEGTVSYLTGGNGKRRERTYGSDINWYNWVGLTIISVEDGVGALQRTFIADSLAHVDGSNPSSGEWSYYLRDHILSTRSMYDASKNALASFAYAPFGTMYRKDNSLEAETDRLYSGHVFDPVSKLYFAPFRHFDPLISNWISRDPLGLIDGPNRYAYVSRNPIRYYDPTGLFLTDLFLALCCLWNPFCCTALRGKEAADAVEDGVGAMGDVQNLVEELESARGQNRLNEHDYLDPDVDEEKLLQNRDNTLDNAEEAVEDATGLGQRILDRIRGKRMEDCPTSNTGELPDKPNPGDTSPEETGGE